MLEIIKIRRDINWLIEQIKCLIKKSTAVPSLAATEWSENHSVLTGNPYILNCLVYFDGIIYKSLANDNIYPPTDPNYWEDLGEGSLLLEEQSDFNATTGRAFIRNKPVNTSDFNNDGSDGVNPFITLEDIPTPDVPTLQSVTDEGNITTNDITAESFIKNGGQDTQFLKADGSVDNNIYLTSADLPSTLELFATTASSDVVGYNVLVRNITDPRFNTIAVDVTTPVINGLVIPCGSLVTDANIISGNPGVFNFTLSGNIRKVSGPTASQAEFYFRIYRRVLAGTETLISQSAKVFVPNNGGAYVLFSTIALWNDGIFLDTDRIVLKFYGDLAGSGSGGTYQFQFGGISPVRSTAAIPVAVLPNIYLKDLADVENVTPINGEVLYWNETANLWEHSSVEDLLPEYTAGSVLFSNGTTITQDNTQFFWDDVNNRLGLGTNLPSAKLYVVGETQTGTSGIGILNLEQTWDTTAAPTAIKLNVTNTASNAVAKLMDLQVGGVSRFYVDRLGNGRFSDGGTASVGFGYGGGTSVSLNGTNLARTSAGGVDIGGNFSYINFMTNNASAMIIHTSTKDVSINTTLDIGAKFQVVGKSMLNGTRFFGQPIPEVLIASTSLSENQITKGIITVTNTVPTSFILPSGTGLDGNLFAFSNMTVDTGLDYTFINLGTAIATITSGTDNPLVGNGVVNVGSSATFRTVKRATNVFVTYRIS